MVKYIIARQIVGKKVVTSDGFDIGRLFDADISETTGKINYLLVEINPDSSFANKLKNENNQVKIPYSALVAANDFVVVDRKELS
ncbi:MAG: PRC-barrel domain-containing protein [Candidatus Micrarchaeia archaeon]